MKNRYLIIILLFLMATTAFAGEKIIGGGFYLQSSEPPNLLLNPNLEDYTGTQDDSTTDVFPSWTLQPSGGGGYIEATATVQDGSNAVKIYNGSSISNMYQVMTPPPPPGDYRLTVWTRGDGTYGSYVAVNTDIDGYVLAKTWCGITGTVYTQKSYDFTLSSSNAWVWVIFYGSNLSPATCYFDNTWVQKIN